MKKEDKKSKTKKPEDEEEEEEEVEEEVEEEEDEEDIVGEDFSKDPRAFSYLQDAGRIADDVLTKEDFLIKKCDCRKPKPGLLLKPKDIYNIDYENSYMIGDSFTDIVAGQTAGVKTIFIGELKCDACKKLCDIEPDHIVHNILEAVEKI